MLFAFLLLILPAQAADLPSCETPRQAADTLLALLQPERYEPGSASMCLDLPPERAKDGALLAVQLKQVLDARGLYVPVTDLPDEPDPVDAEGEPIQRIVPVERFPTASLEKAADGRWLWSRATMEAVPGLYKETFQGLGTWVQAKLPPSFTTARFLGVALWQPIYLLLLLGIAGLLSLLVNLLLQDRARRIMKRFGLAFDQELFDRTRQPVRLILIGGVLLWGLPDMRLGIQSSVAALFAARVMVSIGVVLIGLRWLDFGGKIFLQRAAATESRIDDQVVPLVIRLAKIAVTVLGLVFVLHNVGIDVGSIVAGLGIGGIALALGAQQTLANLFGGVTLFLDRPFHVGDWVVVGGDIEGTVEEIGFRSTRIRTFYSSVITVPNQLVANTRIDNMAERQYRRLKITVGLTYDTPAELLQAFVEGVRAILTAHPAVRKDYFEVHFRDFSASSLDVMVYSFLEVPDWHKELVARSEVLLQIKILAETLGVSFAFPTQSLWLEKPAERPVPPNLPEVVDSFGTEGSRVRTDFAVTEGWNPTAASSRGEDG